MVVRDEGGRRTGSMRTALVEPNAFGLLGAQAALGRLFAAEGVAEGAGRGVILSWDEWQQRFGVAPDTVGRLLRLEDKGARREALRLMLLAASMVWLITAANVVNLFLARAVERRQESAVTAALGADGLGLRANALRTPLPYRPVRPSDARRGRARARRDRPRRLSVAGAPRRGN